MNDTKELKDLIGREEIVDRIFFLINNLKQDEQFCLALNGAWGSGKSFVLDLLEKKLTKHPEYIIIKYDAWENTFYSDPLIAILTCVLDGVDEKLYLVEKREEKMKNAVKTGVNTLAKLSSKIKNLKNIIQGLKGIITDLHNPIDTTALGDFKSYQTLLRETKDLLNGITKKGEYREKQTKLVVVVDEIDRCLPDEQLKILERLHHLSEVKNCVTIVAMNQECVAKTVNTIYGADGYEYLRKFFDFTFKLEMSSEKYLKSLYDGFISSLEKLNCLTDKCDGYIKLAYQTLLYGSTNILDRVDNRELTRYYDAVVNVCNDFGWENLNQRYVFFVLVALFIRKHVSPTFLSQNEIIINQKEKDEIIKSLSLQDPKRAMPYYDYLDFYLGVDRENLPKEIIRQYGWNRCPLPEISWEFNEIIYHSLSGQLDNSGLSGFYSRSTVNVDDCKELVRLVILYGGEQKQCEK